MLLASGKYEYDICMPVIYRYSGLNRPLLEQYGSIELIMLGIGVEVGGRKWILYDVSDQLVCKAQLPRGVLPS